VLIDSPGLQIYGAGQWLEAKHGARSRRTWRGLHLAVAGDSGMIVAQTLTDQDATIRRWRPDPDAGSRTPEIRSLHAGHRRAARSWRQLAHLPGKCTNALLVRFGRPIAAVELPVHITA
jgi:hypothetical protein